MNYVDPSELNPAGPGTTYGGGMLWTLWVKNENGFYNFVHQWFEPYGNGEPVDPSGQQLERGKPQILLDCQGFANLLDFIAGESNSSRQFMDNLARLVIGVSDSSYTSMRNAGDLQGTLRPQFSVSDAGFKDQFRERAAGRSDFSDTRAQAVHFSGGLIAAFNGGHELANIYMAGREGLPSSANAPDRNLNAISIPMGVSLLPQQGDGLGHWKGPPLGNYREFGGIVREKLCKPVPKK